MRHALRYADDKLGGKQLSAFKALIGSVPCVPVADAETGRPRLESARGLYDPSPALPFATLLPEQCVPAELPRDWLPVLRAAGMATHCNREAFLGMAFQVTATTNTADASH